MVDHSRRPAKFSGDCDSYVYVHKHAYRPFLYGKIIKTLFQSTRKDAQFPNHAGMLKASMMVEIGKQIYLHLLETH